MRFNVNLFPFENDAFGREGGSGLEAALFSFNR